MPPPQAEDYNDADGLRRDPVLKMCCGRRPSRGDLTGQPALSRLENSVTVQEDWALCHELMKVFLGRHNRPPRQVVLDLDSTDDEVRGQQQLRFFHGYYGEDCYLPLIVTAQADGGDIWPLFACLRAALHGDRWQAATWLLPAIRKLKAVWPKTQLLVREDSGFASPDLYRLCEEEGVKYVAALVRNPRLQALAEEYLLMARQRYAQTGQRAQVSGQFTYQAESWRRPRQVVVRAEVTDQGENLRFVVHNPSGTTPRQVYQIYRQRGEVENRIKELKLAVKMDRTSRRRFPASAFRVPLHVAAHIPYAALRERPARTELGRAQVQTLRERVVKVAGWVRESAGRVFVQCPQAYPWPEMWFWVTEKLA